MPDADPSATLEAIKERHDKIRTGTYSAGAALADAVADFPRLLTALEAVLKLAADWEQEAIRLDRRVEAHKSPEARQGLAVRAQAHEDCAKELREAITREITGNTDG